MNSTNQTTKFKTTSHRNMSVLIVDDDEVTVFITEMLLKNHGFKPHSVKSGYHALEIIEQHHFDLILMDINLGDINMDGIKTMRLIRQDKRFRKTKILAVTSFSNNQKWFIEQGFDGLLIKPFVPEMIIDKLAVFKAAEAVLQ